MAWQARRPPQQGCSWGARLACDSSYEHPAAERMRPAGPADPAAACCRAVRDIQAGEEVTTAYTELGAPRWERRAALLRHHAFDIDASAGAAEAAGPVGAGRGGAKAQQQAADRAALQCLPAQPAAAEHPLPPARDAPAGELRLYSSVLPPWPHDERDIELTAVMETNGGGASGSGSSGQGARWGGMWGCLPTAGSPAADESFALDDELLEAAAEDAALVAGSIGGPAGPDSGSQQGAAVPAPSRGQQQAPVLHCWQAGGVEQAAAALELATRYAAALQLIQSVDSLLAAGSAAAAVSQLQAALAALGGSSSGASGQGPAAAALALGPRHILRLRLLADLHRAAIAAGQWESALRAGQQLLPLYKFVYPPVSPAGPPPCAQPPCPLLRGCSEAQGCGLPWVAGSRPVPLSRQQL